MKILMVCLGNICRSPMAEGVLKAKLPNNFFVDSAGTIAMHEGEHPDPRSIKAAKNHGIDISAQKSRMITAEDFENFDNIFCMDVKNYQDLISLAKNDHQRGKVALLMEFAGIDENNFEIEDPYFGGAEDFEKMYQIIDRSCTLAAEKLTKKL